MRKIKDRSCSVRKVSEKKLQKETENGVETDAEIKFLLKYDHTLYSERSEASLTLDARLFHVGFSKPNILFP